MVLNKVQRAAFELIQSDARFFYTLTDMLQNAKHISSNYIMMNQPYIGLFTDGAEQWGQKVGLLTPRFNKKEKEYYVLLRQGHKILEKSYKDYSKLLLDKYIESEEYFFKKRRMREKLLGYYNIGVDVCNEEYCGNTIVCASHTPISILGNDQAGLFIRDMSVIVGKLAYSFECTSFPPYHYDDERNIVRYQDFHFYKECPLKLKSHLGLVLFSILCNINYAIIFIENYFIEEIPQKMKFAYLQYYYLCDFIEDLNAQTGMHFQICNSLKNRDFRNCLAHYGLGQFMNDNDIIGSDVLKGLTHHAFNMDYNQTKKEIYKHLINLRDQIKEAIF